MDVQRIPTKKVSDQVAEQLQCWIERGDVAVGDKLPSVRELCDMFQVGRSAVRDAITTLKGRGLVDVRQGEGTFICKTDAADVFHTILHLNGKDIHDLYTVRKMMEISTAELASLERQETHLVMMQEALQELHQNIQMDSWEADYRFHSAIAQATGNDVLVELMDTLSHLMKKALKGLHQTIADDPLVQQTIVAHHEAIYEAIQAVRPEQARETMFVHLTYVEELLQSVLEGSDYT